MLESIIQSLRGTFTPEAVMREDEAKWVKSLGGKTLAEHLAEDGLRREDLVKTLTALGKKIRVFYPPTITIVLSEENILGTTFYGLQTQEFHWISKLPFLSKINTDLITVSLGNRPSMGYDLNLLPGNSWSAAVEKEHTHYIQCDIYDQGVNIMTRKIMDLFAQRHGYTPEVIHYNEGSKDAKE